MRAAGGSRRRTALVLALTALLSSTSLGCDPASSHDPGGVFVTMDCLSASGQVNLGGTLLAFDSSFLGNLACDGTPSNASIQVSDPLLQLSAHATGSRWQTVPEVGFELVCEHDLGFVSPSVIAGLTCQASRSEIVRISRTVGSPSPTKIAVGTRITRIGMAAASFFPPGYVNVSLSCLGNDPITVPENGLVEVELPPFTTSISCTVDASIFGLGSYNGETGALLAGVTSLDVSVFARLGGRCAADSDCASDLRCSPSGTCQDGDEGDPCASSFDPATGGGDCYEFAPNCVRGFCRNGSEGDPCEVVQQCAAGFGCGRRVELTLVQRACVPTCSASQPCSGGRFCVYGLCLDGSNGNTCATSADCVAPLVCDAQTCVSTSGNPGSPCSADTDCSQSPTRPQICHQGHCSAPRADLPCAIQSDCGTQDLPWLNRGLVCIEGICHDGGLGDPCTDDEHCTSRYCHDGYCDGDSGDDCQTWNEHYPSCYAPFVCIDQECDET